MRVPFADVIECLVGFTPPTQRYALMVDGMTEEPEAALNITARREGSFGNVGVGPAPVAHQNASGLRCGGGDLSECGETLKKRRLDEQLRPARPEGQRSQHGTDHTQDRRQDA